MIINNLKSFLDNYVEMKYLKWRREYKTGKTHLKIFGILHNNILVDDYVKDTEEDARNSKTASWWLENPEARVVELELVEKKS
jgi:hypothetical protein